MDNSNTSVPGSAEPQLRTGYLSFWSVKAELGLRGPRRERKVSVPSPLRLRRATTPARPEPTSPPLVPPFVPLFLAALRA